MHREWMMGAVVTAMVVMAPQSFAEEGDQRGVGIGAKFGTLGAGAELTIPLSKRFNGRLGFNRYQYSKTLDSDLEINGGTATTELEGDLNLQSASALLDWHPFAGTFRVSAGYVFNQNDVDLNTVFPAGTVTIGDVDYAVSAGDKLTGTVDFDSGPYLGLGWGNSAIKGWGFSADLGVLYQGAPSVSLAAEGDLATVVDAAELRKQELTAEDDLSSFKYYPVASIGISYGFSL